MRLHCTYYEQQVDGNEDSDEDSDEDAELAGQASLRSQTTSQVEDPLAEFLGVHSGIARILQMSYLASVLIGAQCVTNADTNLTAVMLDTLANLSAFQGIKQRLN